LKSLPALNYEIIEFSEHASLRCVWIPGWGGSSWSLRPIVETLGFGVHWLFDHHHVQQIGRNRQLSIEDMAQSIAETVPEESSPCHLIGISMGGLIAQVLAHSYSEFILSLHLCCTTRGGSGGHRPINEKAANRWWEPVQKGSDSIRRVLEICVAPEYRSSPEFEEYLKHSKSSPKPVTGSTLQMQWNAMENFSSLPLLQSISVVSHLYEGKDDVVVAPGEGAQLAQHLKPASRHILPGGHLFMLEKPVEFRQVFLTNLLNASS
jgi:pimeloyl-ACP methyl ester carboxylesterase